MSFVASVDEVVCSAHAEMILGVQRIQIRVNRLLRTRGDDPLVARLLFRCPSSAPHTRR